MTQIPPPIPMKDAEPRLGQWLAAAARGIAVVPTESIGLTVNGHPVAGTVWGVEVNNGEGGHEGMGRYVAYCTNELDAELVASALWSLVVDVRTGEKG